MRQKYETSFLTPRTLREMREECHDKLYMALSEMIDSIERFITKHEQELPLYSHRVAVWKQRITDGQGEFVNFLNEVNGKLEPPPCGNTAPPDSVPRIVNVSMPSGAVPATPDQSHAVNNAAADVKVGAEIVAAEATNEEIELAMAAIGGYEERFAKIQVSPNAVAEVKEIASMEVKVNTEGDHAEATKDETSDY